MTDNDRKIKLADILMSYANDDKAVSVVLKMNKNPETTFKDYLHAICDGLWYGNWPWITTKQITGSENPIQAIADTIVSIAEERRNRVK